MSLRGHRLHCSQGHKSRRRVVHPVAGCTLGRHATWSHVLAAGIVRAMRRATTGPADHPVVARLAAELTDELGALTEQLVTMLRQADQAYLAVDIEDLHRSVRENLASFVGDLASQRSPSTSSSRDTARRRADEGVRSGRCCTPTGWAFTSSGRARRPGAAEGPGMARRPGARVGHGLGLGRHQLRGRQRRVPRRPDRVRPEG